MCEDSDDPRTEDVVTVLKQFVEFERERVQAYNELGPDNADEVVGKLDSLAIQAGRFHHHEDVRVINACLRFSRALTASIKSITRSLQSEREGADYV